MLAVYTSFGRSGFTPKGKAGVKVGAFQIGAIKLCINGNLVRREYEL